MKHILPILTLTTLTAAAFADASAPAAAAAASGLSYNRVTVAQDTSGQTNRSISVANLINGSNVLVTLGQDTLSTGNDATVSVGYVFKNVTNGIDATVGLSSGTEDAVTVDLRRSLSEVVAGLEVGLGYSHASTRDGGTSWSYEVSYNINKQFSVAFGADEVDGANTKAVALRYNY